MHENAQFLGLRLMQQWYLFLHFALFITFLSILLHILSFVDICITWNANTPI